MIFTPKHAHLIVAGRKSQTRRPAKDTQPSYKVGKTYPVKTGLGKPPLAHIQIIAANLQSLGDITFQDARAEGFKSRDDFFDEWRDLYGNADPSLQVWAYAFVPTAERRYMAKRPAQGERMGNTRDYVSRPHMSLRDEPEVVPAEYQEELTKQAQERWQAHEAERTIELNAMTLDEKVAELQRRKASGAPVDRYLKAISNRVDAGLKKSA